MKMSTERCTNFLLLNLLSTGCLVKELTLHMEKDSMPASKIYGTPCRGLIRLHIHSPFICPRKFNPMHRVTNRMKLKLHTFRFRLAFLSSIRAFSSLSTRPKMYGISIATFKYWYTNTHWLRMKVNMAKLAQSDTASSPLVPGSLGFFS